MEDKYLLSFSISPGVGPKGFQKLLKEFGLAEKAWDGNSSDFKKVGIGEVNFAKFDSFRKTFDTSEYILKLKKAKVEFIPFGDKLYPENLKKIDAPPIGLFIKGNKNLLSESNLIGVVGARKITSYGRDVTEKLVSELSSAGFVIVSGMAMGVDSIAHQIAIDAQGLTIAILGCGVDCPYPRENEKLYEDILDSHGLIVSEYPLGMPANQGTFPARNRIIAGLSFSVLITEAAEDSGSLITAAHALEQNKKIFAVPGPITSQMSKGALKLLKQGAVLVTSADDILGSLNVKTSHFAKASNDKQNSKVSKLEQKILEALRIEERTIDEICRLTAIPITKLSTTLSEMELAGLVKNSGGKFATKNI